MEWTVFLAVVSIVGFIITVVTPIIKLNTTITKLTGLVETMAKDLANLTERNANTHERIFSQLDSHEKRITVLEIKQEETK